MAFCFILKLKITLFYLISFVFICLPLPVIRCHSLSIATTRCHSLPFVVTRFITCCHSLSLVVIRSHLLYHSLSLNVTRCATPRHSLSLVVTRCTIRLFCYKRSLGIAHWPAINYYHESK